MTSIAALDRLYISELNVRKTTADLDIELLADSIERRGLLQQLIVVPAPDRPGFFGVVDGGRRLRALQALCHRGVIKPTHRVPVQEELREVGRECSLAANLQRVANNAADEVEAYRDIIADYAELGEADPAIRPNLAGNIGRCALHFGVTVRHVEQRLRLADLHPEILGALRTGDITLDAAKAYAAYPDRALQAEIFTQRSRSMFADSAGNKAHTPAAIRAAMAGKVYRLGDAHVRYVGVDAYLAEGGRVDRELFMGSVDEEVLLDTVLLDRLCEAKAEAEAAELARAGGYAGALVQPWANPRDFPPTPNGYFASYGGAAMVKSAVQAADMILICRIAADGSKLEATGHCFIKEKSRASAAPAKPATAIPHYYRGPEIPDHEGEAAFLARKRAEAIEARALRLATPKFEGTPFYNRVFWPRPDEGPLRAIRHIPERDEYEVAILLRVPAADVARVMAEAERVIDLEQAERSEIDAAAAADGFDVMPEPAHARAMEPAE